MKKEYLIKASTVEDALENWIWTNDNSNNGFIKITNPKNKKSVVVFKRTIDNNFKNFYNSKRTIEIKNLENPIIIIINEYYRKELEIDKYKNEKFELEINKANCWNKLFNSNWKHPNYSISLFYKTTMVSLILGLVSFFLGVLSIYLTVK